MDPQDSLPQDKSEWVISLTEKLTEAQQYATRKPWEKWSIYRVPRRLRDAQESRKTYEPQTVSIGPYHIGSEEVLDMDFHKWVTLYQILERTGQGIELYLDTIKEVEEQARACYQQQINLSSNKFVEMLVLDGCFILELFLCYRARKTLNCNPVFSKKRIVEDIVLDMVMMENQIPLFILDRLLKLMNTAGNSSIVNCDDHAIDLALNFFNPKWLTGNSLSKEEFNELKLSLEQKEYLHVLDVFRQSLLHLRPQQDTLCRYRILWREFDKLVSGFLKQWLYRLHKNNSANKISRRGQVIHSVTELLEGGVKFKKRNTNCFWDISFKNGVLKIPPIWIQDSTMTILLNVAAFEHCHLKISDAVIASYVVFMECLIKSPEDVGHLHHCGIIQHLLGHDSEVVDMFKSISKEMLVDAQGGYYANISEQVNAHYNQRRNRWRASLLHKYFYNPWAIISLIAAIILLFLTAIQSFYAVYSYYRPNS